MASTYSFDVVSDVDLQEVDNAVNQARKELDNRYDFRGSNLELHFDRTNKTITIIADGEHFVSGGYDTLLQKCIKRGISVLALEAEDIEQTGGKSARQKITFKSGLSKDDAKHITKLVKEQKMKVQAQIMNDVVRVSGKSKDELQKAMETFKQQDFPFPIQFTNYR